MRRIFFSPSWKHGMFADEKLGIRLNFTRENNQKGLESGTKFTFES